MSTPENTSDDGGGREKEEVDRGGLEPCDVFSRLVPDIFLNIMSRVPLSSLSQCRWVSKSWYKLIKSPCFAKVQYEWAVKNNPPYLLFWDSGKDLYLVDDQVFDNLETSAIALASKLNKPERRCEFPGTCRAAGYVNGLFCFASDPDCYTPSSIYVCNPITGERVLIPKSPKYKIPAIAAFGFYPTTNEYKVIRLINYGDEDGEYLSSEGEVYTLGSSEWRKLEDVPHIMDTLLCGVLLNGNLHWNSFGFDSLIINVFNVGSEKFDVIQPPQMLQNDYTSKRVVVVEGHLSFLLTKCGHPYEIWVMQDYGVQSSWVKKYSLNSKVGDFFWYGSHDLIKLRNGEFLLQHKWFYEFIGYLNPEMDTLRSIRITRHEDHCIGQAFHSVVQVGSLISPKGVDESWRRREEEEISDTEDEDNESTSHSVPGEEEDEDSVEGSYDESADLQEPTQADLMTQSDGTGTEEAADTNQDDDISEIGQTAMESSKSRR